MPGLALDDVRYGLDDALVGLDSYFAVDPYISGSTTTTANISASSHVAGQCALVMTASGASQPADATFDAATDRQNSVLADTPFTVVYNGGTAGATFKAWLQIKDGGGNRWTESVTGTYSAHSILFNVGGAVSETLGGTAEFILTLSDNLILNAQGAVSETLGGNAEFILTVSDNLILNAQGAVSETLGGNAEFILTLSDNLILNAQGTTSETLGGSAEFILTLSDNLILNAQGTVSTLNCAGAQFIFTTFFPNVQLHRITVEV